MAQLKVEEYCSSSMKFMNELRRENSLCDVTLLAGSNKLPSHRCVLVAGSAYFRSLFLDPFIESTKGEINLSKVTEDVSALEIILNFLYTGEVDLTLENIGAVLELSSFFLIEKLREQCGEFMTGSLCLSNCLSYYLSATDHGFVEQESRAGQMVKSRFHDCLIHKETTLNLTPRQLKFLIYKNILKHCSVSSILSFIIKWVLKDQTVSCIEVGLELLEALENKVCGSSHVCTDLDKFTLQAYYDKLSKVLKESKIKDSEIFLSRLNAALQSLFSIMEKETWNVNVELRNQGSGSLDSEQKNRETEMAIFTLSPKLCVIEDYNRHQKENMYSSDYIANELHQPVFDLCAYVPRTKSWYYLHEVQENIPSKSVLVDLGYGTFLVHKNQVLMVENRDSTTDILDLKTNSWKNFDNYYDDDFFDFDIQTWASCSCTHQITLLGNNGEVFTLKRTRLISNFSEPEFDTYIYFRFYVLYEEEAGEENWLGIFNLPSNIPKNKRDGWLDLKAKISATSNELLVFHSNVYVGEGWNMAFVADLNDTLSDPVVLLTEFCDIHDAFHAVEILEMEDRFLIVLNGTKYSKGYVQVVYEYKFNSKVLSKVTGEKMAISVDLKPAVEFPDDTDETIDHPCHCKLTASVGDSFWFFEGNMDTVSVLKKVSVNSEMQVNREDHPPPPFACVTKMFTGPVNKSLLTNEKLNTRFLIKEKMPSHTGVINNQCVKSASV